MTSPLTSTAAMRFPTELARIGGFLQKKSMKTCSRCNENKPESSFGKDVQKLDGRKQTKPFQAMRPLGLVPLVQVLADLDQLLRVALVGRGLLLIAER